MTTVQQWGQKRVHHWPPRGFYYTYGAIFLAIVATWISCLCPLRIRPLGAAAVLPALLFADGDRRLHAPHEPVPADTSAMENRAPGSRWTPMFDRARRHNCQDTVSLRALGSSTHAGLPVPCARADAPVSEQGIAHLDRALEYADTSTSGIFATPLYCGILALILQLPFSVRKDIRRRKELRYGRRLKGPILVSPHQFTSAVGGDGIGITTNDDSRPLRVPRNAENKHFLVVGDTGSGKSSIIRQMLYQVADRGDSAIVYDPACEFVKQFYDERRGDIVLNPSTRGCHIGIHRTNFAVKPKPKPWLSPSTSRKV